MSHWFENFLNYFKIRKRQIILVMLSFLMGAILFASVFFYVDYQEITRIILRFQWWKFFIFLAVSSIQLFMTTYRWSLVLKTQGFRVCFLRLFQYRLAGFGFSYLTPIAELGGGPFRAYLLKREGIPFSQGFLTVIIDNFLEIFTQSILAAFGILFFLSHFGFSRQFSWLLGITTFIFVFAAIWLFFRLRKGLPILAPFFRFLGAKKLHQKISRLEKPFIDFFSQNKKVFGQTIKISCLVFLVTIIEVATLLYLMGYYMGILDTFFAKIILSLANLFPVPAALGVSEWAQAGFFGRTFAGKSVGLIFSILFKAKCLFYSFLGIAFFSYWWQKRVRWDKYLINYLRQKLHA